MIYSTIKRKKCKCGCNKYPTLGWGGYFMAHAPQELKDKQTKKQVEKRNKAIRARISKMLHNVSESKLSANGGAVLPLEQQLGVWFITRMTVCEPICENCGKIGEYLKMPEFKKLWRSCQAHLLPKRHFKSLQTHPLNGMVLGTGFSGLCHCHDDYDSSWEKAAKMPIWEEVVKRFLIMYPLISPEEHQYIPPQLLQELPQNQI